jgi:hypothetical protein
VVNVEVDPSNVSVVVITCGGRVNVLNCVLMLEETSVMV